jgi:hypothetical protein
MDMETKFWRHATKAGEDDCWQWAGNLNEKGYGRIKHYRSRKWVKAHRYSYELHHGEIPAGMLVLHSCDNRSCVNPKHLRIGTCMDNSQDMVARGRAGRGPGPTRSGSAHPYAKLTEADIPVIRDLVKSGATMPSVAARFGVGVSAIHNVFHGKTWKHVPGGEPSEPKRAALLTDEIKAYIDQRILELLGKGP